MVISEKLETIFIKNFLLPLDDQSGFEVVKTYLDQPRKRPMKSFQISPIIKRKGNTLELFCIASVIHLQRNIVLYTDMDIIHWDLRKMKIWNPAAEKPNAEYEAWKKLETYYELK